ncbi:MAG TPA: hotdog domain-containing protein [Mycobacteriales bacterium]|jgi:predicted thioesterase|nr:hotdog domain-containing protein [Mycobacteriales bacterium]
MPLDPGLRASFAHTVTDADTALAHGSGDVPVLATPRVLALAERATCAAVADHITDDLTTVGTRVALDHVAPTPVGATVHVDAVLEAVDGRRLTFGVRVRDDERDVATGTVTRTLVTRDRFLRTVTP